MYTRLRLHLSVCPVAVLLMYTASASSSSIDQEWLAKAKTEGKLAYNKYLSVASRLEERSEIRSEKDPTGAAGKTPFRAITRRIGILRLDDNVIHDELRLIEGSPSQHRLLCDNPMYHFSLSKGKDDSPWAITEYTKEERKYPLLRQTNGLHSIVYLSLWTSLSAVEANGSYKLLSLQWNHEKKTVVVEYEGAKGVAPARYKTVLFPEQGWRVMEHHVDAPNLASSALITYGETIDGVGIPTEFRDTIKYRVANPPPDLIITGKLLSIKKTTKSPEDFRLAAFGFPEPVDVPPPKTTPRYVWVLAAAAASALIAFVFAFLRRRHAARLAAKSGGGS